LQEHEDGRRDSQPGVDAQQLPDRRGATDQAGVEGLQG
jgi:hypothetical protein